MLENLLAWDQVPQWGYVTKRRNSFLSLRNPTAEPGPRLKFTSLKFENLVVKLVSLT